MRIVPKSFKKLAVSVVLSTCLISSLVAPAFAAIDVSSLSNRIGNQLEAEFNVTALPEVENTVVISWDDDALDIDLESYDLTKDVSKTIHYYVTPGVDNDDDITVGVLLKVPAASVAALTSLEYDGNPISSEFSEAGFTYYVLTEGLDIAPQAVAYAGEFDIAFDAVTGGTPFTASLIAIEEVPEALLPAPDFNFEDFDMTDGQFDFTQISSDEATEDWANKLETVYYRLDTESAWISTTEYELILEDGHYSIKFTGAAVPEEYSIYYKLQSAGYEDVIFRFELL